MKPTVSINDLEKLDLRVGVIESVEDVENSSKLYYIKVNIGDHVISILSGIKRYYKKEELLNKRIIVIVNLEHKIIAGKESEGMLLAAEHDNTVSLLTVDKELPAGSIVS
ncbi:MAG: methionine--tRNA ligase [Candidatus Micrarchaeota archaeon]|nr:MAG: methionine--tRNA ligase [Candidatus Micrarchaeota archaeon]